MTTKRLLDVCDFQGGTQPPKDEWINDPCEGYVRMLQIRDYSQGDAKFIQYVKDTKKLHKCTKDDIMLSRYGYIGQAFIGLEGAYNVALVKVIKKAEIHTPYLLCYFQSYYFQHFLLSNVGARATIPGFNKDELENALIRIPEMCEQIEIASKITKVDELIGFHKQQLNVLDTLIKSRFIEMFVANKNVCNWSQVSISDVSTNMRTGPFGSALHHDEFVDSGVFVLGIDNAVENRFSYNRMRYITEEKYNQLKRYTVYPGDVIITIMGTVGRSAVIPQDMPKAINTKHLACITPDSAVVDPCFLSLAFQMHPAIRLQLQNQCKGAIMDGLNLTIIKGLRFQLPPIDQQKQFSEFVEQTDKSKFYIVQMQILLRLLIRAIQQKTTEVLL